MTFKNLTLIAFATVGCFAQAAQLATRTDLNNILGGAAVTDDFEGFAVPDFNQYSFDGVLNSSKVTSFGGPGLVNSGASYKRIGTKNYPADFFVSGHHYFQMTSKTLAAGSTVLEIDYTSPVIAMGLDVMDFSSYSGNVTMRVYSASGLLGVVNVNAPGAPDSKFLGWEDANGIVGVTLTGTHLWSPVIDNHEYGTVPEPATMAALGLGAIGMARRKRKA
ncbi:MAG: PEP-CTERM sorting domain-containing protein [Armatimonadetes bacterium]|nr:PEP-CTERM sorting domain-containing protein [Armatimonadota bacterium]